jgi:hypothetical protein
MVNLDLSSVSQAEVSEEQVRNTYLKAVRAARLLQNPDFQAWRKDVEAGKERQIRKLIGSGEGGDRKRGMIVAVEKLYSELEILAGEVDQLGSKLESYERIRTQPADQRSWLR